MSTPLTPEQRKKRFVTITSIMAVAILGFLISPFIVATIKGILGLITCIIIMGVTWALVTPFLMFLGNLRLKQIKAEIWRSPVETMQTEYHTRAETLDAARERIKEMKGRIASFDQKIDDLKSKIRPEKYQQMMTVSSSLWALYQNRLSKYENARVKLGEFFNLIEQAGAEWEAAKAANDATEWINMAEGDILSQLKVGESINAIRSTLNTAMAELDTELADNNAEQRLMAQSQTSSLPAPQADNFNTIVTHRINKGDTVEIKANIINK